MSKTPLLCSLLALGWAAACTEATAEHAKPTTKPDPVTVAPALVTEEATPDVLTLTGRLTADQRAEVTADTQGKVIDVFVKRGQRVRRGEPLVRLDVGSAALQTREAAARLESARAEKALADVECKRGESLLSKGAITQSEADRIATRCRSAMSEVSAASARTQVLAKNVTDGIVRAPFDGVVASKAVTAGEWVMPGRALLTLVDADPLTIELSVPESSVNAVELGASLSIKTIANRGKTYAAKITRRGAELGNSRSLIVEATLAPNDDLVPGMFAEAEVITGWTQRPVIPASAAIKRGGDYHVFVMKSHELEDRIIQVGTAGKATQLAVLSNLAKGEVIVREPTPTMADGQPWTE